MVTPVDHTHDPSHTDAGAAVDDAVQVLHERLDVLLDRPTDTVLRAPSPGFDRWRSRFQDPDELTHAATGTNGHCSPTGARPPTHHRCPQRR